MLNSEAYETNGYYDEMFAPGLSPRPGCTQVVADLVSMPPAQLAELRTRADRMFLRMGVTFNVYGDEAGAERIFPFDPIPRVIDGTTWAHLEAGLVQRVRALNAFLADVYGPGEILKDGVVPRDLIVGSPQFRHAAVGLRPPGGVFITVAGIDLVRGADGRFCVLEDNVRTPSGVSYVIENRVVMTRLMPELIRGCGVRSVEGYPGDLLASLREIAPVHASRPRVALLTPGPHNSAFFEHVYLSQQMGIELVEGQDLVCVDHKLFTRTVHGLERIDVLYRRIDDDFLDPIAFRADSLLGVAGLMAAVRAGNVSLANMVGTGVADDKAVFAYTPAIIRYYLGESPILPIVETHLLRDPDVRRMVLRDLDRYVVKPTGASGGYGVVIGPKASYRELAETRERIERFEPPPSRGRDLTFAEFLAEDEAHVQEHHEFLAASHYVPFGDRLRRFFWQARPGSTEGVAEYTTRMVAYVRDQFEYEAGRSNVNSTVDDILASGGGVCQDFAHLTIGILRLAGVPARYVSGYLAPRPEAGTMGAPHRQATHAWIEALLPGSGWTGFDPTHRGRIELQHVRIGVGRDYADVPPLKGVFRSHGYTQSMGVDVRIDELKAWSAGPGAEQ